MFLFSDCGAPLVEKILLMCNRMLSDCLRRRTVMEMELLILGLEFDTLFDCAKRLPGIKHIKNPKTILPAFLVLGD